MQLIYRGLRYQPKAVYLETFESGMIGKYRGLDYSVRQRLGIRSQPVLNLKYRGIAYRDSIV